MRIVFLHHANVCRGGIERMLTMRANALAERMGYDVLLLTYEQNSAPYPYPLSAKVQCVDLGVKLYSAYKWPFPLRILKKWSLRRQLAEAIGDTLRRFRPDIVVCTDKDTYEQRALVKAHTTEKLVVEAHTGMVDHEMQIVRTTNIVRRFFAKRDLEKLKESVGTFDALIALTESDAACWSPSVKTVVMPNYLTRFPARPTSHASVRRRVISVGRLDYQKGQDLLLMAWQQVEHRHPDWHLDIFGDGKEEEPLRELVAKLGLKEATIHPTTTDIYAEYMASDFLVCSSRWESFGLIIIEAMSCGLPVISFDCDNGPRHIINDGSDGLLARNGDIADLSAKINWMVEHHDERIKMGEAAYRHAEHFREENVFPLYTDFYERLTQDVKPAQHG